MDILKEWFKMAKQKGFATLLALGLIIAALAGGAVVGRHMKPDSIPEQSIEAYLRAHGIECYFSASHLEKGDDD